MTKTPLVSVIIPTHNRKKMLLRLIKSILAGNYHNVEIIIIDDASTDGTSEVIKRKYSKNKKIKILRNETNLQTSTSKNKGAKIAKGKFLFFVDDDNVVSSSLISTLVHQLSSNRKLGEVGPVIYYYTHQSKVAWSQTKRDMFTTRIHARSDINKFATPFWYTDDIPNSFMVKSAIVRGKVMFNDALGIMYEEADYAFKLRKLGYQIAVIRDAKIYHDIAYITNDKKGLLHTMQDKARVYYIARNRLIFHTEYSTKFQLLSILIFWNWVFMFYYIFNILFYSGVGKYTLYSKLRLLGIYMIGIFDGYIYAIRKL